MNDDCPRCEEPTWQGGVIHMDHLYHPACLTDHLYDMAKDDDGHASEQDVRAGVGVGDRFRDPDGHAALAYSDEMREMRDR